MRFNGIAQWSNNYCHAWWKCNACFVRCVIAYKLIIECEFCLKPLKSVMTSHYIKHVDQVEFHPSFLWELFIDTNVHVFESVISAAENHFVVGSNRSFAVGSEPF